VKKSWIISGIVFAAFFLGLILCGEERFDYTRVEPELAQLKRPFRSTRPAYFLDGGSIGLVIVDGCGKTLKIALPVEGEGLKREYPRLVVGVEHISELGKSPAPTIRDIELNEDTRKFLTIILRKEAQPGADRDAALMELGRRTPDSARIIGKALLRKVLAP
jgi:hypothetical protein